MQFVSIAFKSSSANMRNLKNCSEDLFLKTLRNNQIQVTSWLHAIDEEKLKKSDYIHS